ncbi:MAG: hypothetical protein AAF806_20235 [Bacteroidota bacterium]
MLTRLRTYCFPILALLLISYVANTFQHFLVEIYYEVATTARVTNSIYSFDTKIGHDHSQEIALTDLEQLKEKSNQQKQEQQQRNYQQLKKQVKIINEISGFSDCLTLRPPRNFNLVFSLSSVIQQINLPPPRFFA